MSVKSAVETELRTLGLEDTVEGQAALVLAGNLDSGRNGMAKQGDTARLMQVMEELRRRRPLQKTHLELIRDDIERGNRSTA